MLTYMGTVIVVLINVLIAQLSSTYDQAKKVAKLQYDVDRILLLTRMEGYPFLVTRMGLYSGGREGGREGNVERRGGGRKGGMGNGGMETGREGGGREGGMREGRRKEGRKERRKGMRKKGWEEGKTERKKERRRVGR